MSDTGRIVVLRDQTRSLIAVGPETERSFAAARAVQVAVVLRSGASAR